MKKIERMKTADLSEVMELERETFTSPWTEGFFRDELDSPHSHIFLARDEDGRLAGFICFWALYDEMHILNIAVREGMRRRGVGSSLLAAALEYAHKRGAVAATLEVREKNDAAIMFYESFGFRREGLRKGYYDHPADNAVIMWKRRGLG